MDYKYRYLNNLRKLIKSLDRDIQNEIYYDLIKIEDWLLPDLDELEMYFEKLDYDIDRMTWKFILKELSFPHHCYARNSRVIQMLNFIKNNNLKIKPFVIRYSPTFYTWQNDEGYFLYSMKIKKYNKTDYYQRIYNELNTDYLLRCRFC